MHYYYFQLHSDMSRDEIPGASHQAVSQTEELSGATASPGEFKKQPLLLATTLDKIWDGFLAKQEKQDFLVDSQLIEKSLRGEILPNEEEDQNSRRGYFHIVR